MSEHRPTTRFLKPGEMLAINPNHLHRGPEGFFWFLSDPPKPSERVGSTQILYVRGELEHHKSTWGGESYEGLVEKVQCAVAGQDCVDAYEREHRYDDDYEPMVASAPKTIISCIDSPGGVVAGLNANMAKIRTIRLAHPEIRWIVYLDEMAASAAYAAACALGDEIVAAPVSAISGSIGVISTMISQARKNEKEGYDVVLLTSGARKADGHVHAPISDKAKEVEMDRVEKLATAFWRTVSKARGIPMEKVEGFQAGIFLSKDAKKRGLIDAIMSFDDVLLGANDESTSPSGSTSGGNKTDRRVRTVSSSITPRLTEAVMPIALDALIKKTEKALAAEKDTKKKTLLTASLDAYKKTKHTIEKHEEESGDDEDEDEEEEESEESEETEDGKKEDLPPKDKDDDDSDDDDDDDEDDEDDEEEDEEKAAKAALAAVQKITGMKGKKALGALQALAATSAQTAIDVAALKKAAIGREKASLISEARGKFLTKKEATWLSGQKLSTVRGFVEMRQKSGVIVNTDESTLLRPKHVAPDSEESLPTDTLAMIEDAVANFPGDRKAFRATLVKAHLDAKAQPTTAVLNGAPGRI